MNANWVNKIEIGVSATTADPPVWTYADLCKGIESMEFNENEQNQQYFFLCGEGFAHNEVTGAAPELVISGRRIVGDTAQDYIAGLQFKLGSERNTSVKITAEGKEITSLKVYFTNKNMTASVYSNDDKEMFNIAQNAE